MPFRDLPNSRGFFVDPTLELMFDLADGAWKVAVVDKIKTDPSVDLENVKWISGYAHI